MNLKKIKENIFMFYVHSSSTFIIIPHKPPDTPQQGHYPSLKL